MTPYISSRFTVTTEKASLSAHQPHNEERLEMTCTDKHVIRKTFFIERPCQPKEPLHMMDDQPTVHCPRHRLRQQVCQRGLSFVANAATAARHKTCDSHKPKVQLKRMTRLCYWHEYSLKLCDNDGSIFCAFIFASSQADAQEKAMR